MVIPFTRLLYKALLLIILFFIIAINTFSQEPFLPAPYQSIPTTHNFVRSYTVLKPGLSSSDIVSDSRLPTQVQLTTQYLDGLGRPLQSVIRKGSLNTASGETKAKDLIAPHTYDEFGREAYQFLPFVATGEADGSFKGPNPFQMQQDFYNSANVNSPIIGQGETYYYSKTIFEPSPLNRVTEQYAPGNSWVGSEENEKRSIKSGYFFNTPIDTVRIWNVTDDAVLGNFGTYTTPGAYAAGQLYKTITNDEHGKQIIEFKDKQGQVILKKVQLTAEPDTGTGKDHSGWICTYYIYDDFGSLRCVVQPEGVKWLSNNNWNFNLTNGSTILNEQCFRYEYDARRRMIMKKVPGALEVSMVYDARDRLVLSQDGNLRWPNGRKWLYTQYDDLNRPIKTGMYRISSETGTAAERRNVMAAQAADKTAAFTPYYVQDNDVLTSTQYDNYDNLGTNTIHGFTSDLIEMDGFSPENNTDYPYARALVKSTQTRGLPTITFSRVLGSNNSVTNLYIYDEYGRVIQLKSYNHLGKVTDITTTQYGFAGQPLRTLHRQRINFTGQTAQTLITVTANEFDDLGRLTKTNKRIGHVKGSSLAPALSAQKTIMEIAYDALGQVKKKKLGVHSTSAGLLDSLTYDYNIRGWLLGVNRSLLASGSNTAPAAGAWFGFDLGYDKIINKSGNDYAAPQYNGNIAGQSWRSAGDNVARQYRYNYDAANRLMNADFVQNQNGWGKSFNFDSKMGNGTDPLTAYDLNGNILQMQQWGWTPQNQMAQIDSLTYSYNNGSTLNQTFSNKLHAVNDAVAPTSLGDFSNNNTTVTDYGYDNNGNLVIDLNKKIGKTGINGIIYNHLNLPENITLFNADGTTKGCISYTYDAGGNKIRKQVEEEGVTIDTTTNITIITTTDYRGGAVYETKTYTKVPPGYANYSWQLQFTGHEEGRIRALRIAPHNNLTGFVYDYSKHTT